MTETGDKFAKSSKNAAGKAAKAMGSAAVKGAKKAASKVTGEESNAEWLIRVITSLPKYLRLYFLLLTDSRVSGKVKVFLVTAVTALGAHFAFSGLILAIQNVLASVLGPFAFIPTVLIMLVTLDFCYKLIDADVMEEHEREIFGETDSLASDINRLREYMGSMYDKFVGWWTKKVDRAEEEMADEGLIVDGDLTEEAIQEVSDQIVELETSDALEEKVEKNVKLLKSSEKEANAILEGFEKKLLEK